MALWHKTPKTPKPKLTKADKEHVKALRRIERQGKRALFWTDFAALATGLFVGVVSLMVAYFEWQTLSVLIHGKLWLLTVVVLAVCLLLVQVLLLDSGFGYYQNKDEKQGKTSLSLLTRLNWLFLLFLVILMMAVSYAFLVGDDGKVATWLSNFVLSNFEVG